MVNMAQCFILIKKEKHLCLILIDLKKKSYSSIRKVDTTFSWSLRMISNAHQSVNPKCFICCMIFKKDHQKKIV
jgi:hypothetical protein